MRMVRWFLINTMPQLWVRDVILNGDRLDSLDWRLLHTDYLCRIACHGCRYCTVLTRDVSKELFWRVQADATG
jgi:hypothetical protein